MVLLPSLVFGTEIESSGVLQVWWEYNGLVTSFAGKLHTKVPAVESHKGEVEVLRGEVFGSEGIETVDCISESSCVSNMFPGESCQAC